MTAHVSSSEIAQKRKNSFGQSGEFLVKITKHFKKQQLSVEPQYMEEDPVVGGKPSMRIFHIVRTTTNYNDGQVWRAQQVGKPVPGGKNTRGVRMVHFNVRLLDQA